MDVMTLPELVTLIGAVATVVGGVVGWIVAAWKTGAERGKTQAEQQKIIGEAYTAVIHELRQAGANQGAHIEAQAARIEVLEGVVQRLREASEAHARERVAWLDRERELEMKIAELQGTLAGEMERFVTEMARQSVELESLREHAQHLAAALAARDAALDLERALRTGELTPADVTDPEPAGVG